MTRILSRVLVRYKLIAILVDAVVGQMNEVVLNLCRIIAVLCCGKSNQAIFIDVELDWIDTGEENIETQIKLETFDKEGLVNVLLKARKKKGAIVELKFLPEQPFYSALKECHLKMEMYRHSIL